MPPIGLGNPLPIGRMGIGPPNSIGTGGLPGPMMPGPRFARVSDPFAPRTPAKTARSSSRHIMQISMPMHTHKLCSVHGPCIVMILLEEPHFE